MVDPKISGHLLITRRLMRAFPLDAPWRPTPETVVGPGKDSAVLPRCLELSGV
jgi:hypothetical protein